MRIRRDLTGDAVTATDLLARRAARRLHRGHTPGQVRVWVASPGVAARYGGLAVCTVLVLMSDPHRVRVEVVD